MKTTTETQVVFQYTIRAPWTDPQGVIHQPRNLTRNLVAGDLFHPEFQPMKGVLKTQETRNTPAFTVPDELVKITKVTTTTVITETEKIQELN
jgi:hypothetical protein